MDADCLRSLGEDYSHILDHLGRLYEESLNGPLDGATLANLHRLNTALEAHFARERAVMRATGYPDAGRHEERHGLIRGFLDKLAAAAERRDEGLFRREIPFLLHLVLDHRSVAGRRLDAFVDGLEAGAAVP